MCLSGQVTQQKAGGFQPTIVGALLCGQGFFRRGPERIGLIQQPENAEHMVCPIDRTYRNIRLVRLRAAVNGLAQTRFLASGNLPEGARLEATVTHADGETATLTPVPLVVQDGHAEGEFSFAVSPGKSLGAFRIGARVVDADGTPLGAWSEAVVARVKQPRHWGAFAPTSPFGVHCRPTLRHVTMAKAIGNNWVRLHNDGNHITAWAMLEPTKGEWHWSDADLGRYREGHMEVLGMLETAPKWASLWGLTARGEAATGGPGYFEMYFQPRDLADFANYVSTVVTHYKDQISAYEIWNEPWQIKWFGTHYVEDEGRQKIMTSDHPQKDYVGLMRTAFETAKAIDPSITIVGFNTTSNAEFRPVPEGVYSGPEWTAGVLAADGESYADAASFHHYTSELSGFPDDDVTQAVRDAFGPNAKVPTRTTLPVWMTEGSSTVGGLVRHGLCCQSRRATYHARSVGPAGPRFPAHPRE